MVKIPPAVGVASSPQPTGYSIQISIGTNTALNIASIRRLAVGYDQETQPSPLV